MYQTPMNEAPVGPAQVREAVTPLRMIFWGGLLCVFDFTFTTSSGGTGFKCDILNDVVGMILITIGVFRLGSMRISEGYAAAMTFVRVIAVLATIDAVREVFLFAVPPMARVGLFLLGVACMVATVLFCVAMRRFCRAAALAEAERSWQVTTILFVVIYLVPLGLFYLIAAGAIVTESSFNIELGVFGLLLLPVFAVPIIHLFISTSRMKRAAEQGPPAGTMPPGMGPHGGAPPPGAPPPPPQDWR